MNKAGDGGGGQMAILAVVVTVVLAMFGGIYSLAQSVSEVNTKLDRNCAILKDISLGLRLHDIREFNLLQNVPHGARNGVAFGSFPNVTC